MMATHRSTWKSFERRVAKRLGTERNSKHGLGEDTAEMARYRL